MLKKIPVEPQQLADLRKELFEFGVSYSTISKFSRYSETTTSLVMRGIIPVNEKNIAIISWACKLRDQHRNFAKEKIKDLI